MEKIIFNIPHIIGEVSRHLMTNESKEIQNYMRNFMEIDVSLQTIEEFFNRSMEEEDTRSLMNIFNYYESKDLF